MKNIIIYFVFLASAVLLVSGCGAKKAPVATPPSPVGLTMETVAAHNTADNCWMVINNNVYMVTDYIEEHPGGKKILDGCGKDATETFNGDPHNHSDYARELLADYYIGDLKK